MTETLSLFTQENVRKVFIDTGLRSVAYPQKTYGINVALIWVNNF